MFRRKVSSLHDKRCHYTHRNTTIRLLTVVSFMCKTGCVKQETNDDDRTKRGRYGREATVVMASEKDRREQERQA